MAKKKHRHQPGRLNSITACISTGMVLILIGTIAFFGMMASSIERSIKETFTVQVLLDDSLSQADTRVLQKEISQTAYTREVTYFSKEDAARTMAIDLGEDAKNFVGKNPYPASFEISLNADYTHPDSLKRYMPGLRKAQGVMDVVYPEDLMASVNDNISRISLVLLIVALLLSVVSVSLINNTMRLNIAQRRHSIQTMKLVGASWGFIRRPFLWRAFWIGLVASVLADGVLAAGFVALLNWDPDNASLVTPGVIALTLVIVAAVGIALTLVCAFFSVNKHLAMSRDEAALY